MRGLVLICLISVISAFGQNAQALYEKNFKKGNEILESNIEQVDMALSYYLAANKHLVGPKRDLYYRIGLCYLLQNSDKGLDYFDAINKPFFKSPPILLFLMGRSHQIAGDYHKAKEYYWEFIQKVEKKAIVKGLKIDAITAYLLTKDEAVLKGKEFKKEDVLEDVFLKITSCERGINYRYKDCIYGSVDSQVAFSTIYGDRNAVKNDQKNWLISSRMMKDASVKDPKSKNRYNEDLFIESSEEQILPSFDEINTQNDERVLQFDYANNALYFTREVTGRGKDIFRTYLVDDTTWSKPYRMSAPINSKYNETSLHVYDKGMKMVFTSDRVGGWGGLDIYYTEQDEDGDWSDPVNLEDSINSPFDEDGVFFDTVEMKLFYSSNGHNTIGGMDIFESQYNETYEDYSSAKNIGYPVNTSNDEMYFKYINRYQDALFVSNRPGGKGDYDIYLALAKDRTLKEKATYQVSVDESDTLLSVTVDENYEGKSVVKSNSNWLPLEKEKIEKVPEVKENATPRFIHIRGEIEDKENEVPIVADIIVRKEDGTILKEVKSREDGSFECSITETGSIVFECKALAYNSKMHNVFLMDDAYGQRNEVHINMIADTSDVDPYTLKELRFEEGRWGIEGENKVILDDLIAYLKLYPFIRIKIYGHADLNEAGTNTKRISANRSWGTKQYMIKNGIQKHRLISFGYGDEKPMTKGRSDDEKALNRRVAFKILDF